MNITGAQKIAGFLKTNIHFLKINVYRKNICKATRVTVLRSKAHQCS